MSIPEALRLTIHSFCTDMWEGYLTAIQAFLATYPEVEARIVVDRFHVARNYRADFDKLRKQECRRLRQTLTKAAYQEIVQGTHWILRHNHASLDEEDRARLRLLFQHTPQLHQAYTLREELTAIFNSHLTLTEGQHRLQQWQHKVQQAQIGCFDTFLKTLKNHFEAIANYFHQRATSGFVEGINNKLKVITRRSYGLKRVDSLFRRLWLDINARGKLLA